MDERFRFVHVYTSRAGVAVEPMTCAPDAFNSGDGLLALAPGALVRRPLGPQHTTGGAVMRRSSRATSRVMGVAVAVVALAVIGRGARGGEAAPRRAPRPRHLAGACRSRRRRSARSKATAVDRYTLANGSMSVSILTYGGIIQELWAPDRRGRLANITLGYSDLDGLHDPRGDPPTPNPSYFGGIIGRYGNRIANARVHARRQRLHARRQQRPQQPPRRRPGLRPLRVGRGAVQEATAGRR